MSQSINARDRKEIYSQEKHTCGLCGGELKEKITDLQFNDLKKCIDCKATFEIPKLNK